MVVTRCRRLKPVGLPGAQAVLCRKVTVSALECVDECMEYPVQQMGKKDSKGIYQVVLCARMAQIVRATNAVVQVRYIKALRHTHSSTWALAQWYLAVRTVEKLYSGTLLCCWRSWVQLAAPPYYGTFGDLRAPHISKPPNDGVIANAKTVSLEMAREASPQQRLLTAL